MNINLDEFVVIKNIDWSILLKPKIKVVQVNLINDLNDYNFTNSIIESVYIENKEYTKISNYRKLLIEIYLKINNGVKIIKNSIINLSTLNLNDKGFNYLHEIGISFQGADSNKSMKEIFNQAIKNSIKLKVSIKHSDGGTICYMSNINNGKLEDETEYEIKV